MTEAEAITEGHEILVSRRPMSLVSRAVEKGETTGLMKLVADANTRQILGAAIFGVGGDEAIHAVLNLMSAGETVDALRWAVPINRRSRNCLRNLLSTSTPAAAVSD